MSRLPMNLCFFISLLVFGGCAEIPKISGMQKDVPLSGSYLSSVFEYTLDDKEIETLLSLGVACINVTSNKISEDFAVFCTNKETERVRVFFTVKRPSTSGYKVSQTIITEHAYKTNPEILKGHLTCKEDLSYKVNEKGVFPFICYIYSDDKIFNGTALEVLTGKADFAITTLNLSDSDEESRESLKKFAEKIAHSVKIIR